MSGYRQAAVALHALDNDDSEAILAELPEADRTALRACLAELNELGFDRDDMALARPASRQASQAQVHSQPRLRESSAAQIFAILEHEPATLVARILQLEDWPWAGDLLAMFAPPRRALIRAAQAQTPAAAPALGHCLLETLALAAAASAPPETVGRAAFVAPLLRLVKSWAR